MTKQTINQINKIRNKTRKETIDAMAEFLLKESAKTGISLRGLNLVNYNSFLDRTFRDGGLTRRKFIDFAVQYSSTTRGSKEKDTKVIVCIEGALEIVIEHLYQEEKRKRMERSYKLAVL